MDRIGVVYAARPNKRTSRLCEKIKTKELWVLSKPNKTRDMTDRIGVVYAARRQNERLGQIVWVMSTLETKHKT